MSSLLDAKIPDTDDPEELLVVRGWSALRHRIADINQHIRIERRASAANTSRLTRREFQVIYLAAIGIGGKQAAAELSVAWTTARAALSSALAKLDLRGYAHVPAFWYGLATGGPEIVHADETEILTFGSRFAAREPATTLTGAERDLLHGVISGDSNQEIAGRRRTSERTVANQLARLFRKFAVSTRLELAAKALHLLPAKQHVRWLRAT